MSHIVTKASHRRIIFILLVLFLCFILPSQSSLRPSTLRPGHNPAYYKQGSDQIPFEGDISSLGATPTWPERVDKVKAAFIHAYAGYKTYAFGMDELRSVSNVGVNK
jgi:hypothetical protein